MFIVENKKKAKFFIAIIEVVLVVLFAEFFLSQIETDGVIEWAFLSFVLFFLSSFFTVKYIFHEKASDYYLVLKPKTKTIILSFLAAILYVGVLWTLVVQLDWEGSMPISNWVLGTTGLMIFFDVVVIPLVVFSKEFFFRGFLMKSSAAMIGVFGAIILQAILATFYEVYIAGLLDYKHVILLFLPNLFLGYIAYINRSIIISALFSWVYLLAVDFIFAYKLTQ